MSQDEQDEDFSLPSPKDQEDQKERGGDEKKQEEDNLKEKMKKYLPLALLLVVAATFFGFLIYGTGPNSSEKKTLHKKTPKKKAEKAETDRVDQSNSELKKKVWEAIPDELEPRLKKFEDLIEIDNTLQAYDHCTVGSDQEMANCADFLDIVYNVDNENVVVDRIYNIRYRH